MISMPDVTPDTKITARKMSYLALVNVDEDGTPLDLHGERMVEIEPGIWVESLVAMAMDFISQHCDTDVKP